MRISPSFSRSSDANETLPLEDARHKATDRFIETFEPLVDRFVEAAQGINIAEAMPPWPYLSRGEAGGDDRIGNYTDLTPEQREVTEFFEYRFLGRGAGAGGEDDYLGPLVPITDDNAERFLSAFSIYMATLELPQSELAQIRDDMLEIADVTLYLFTLQ